MDGSLTEWVRDDLLQQTELQAGLQQQACNMEAWPALECKTCWWTCSRQQAAHF